MSQQDERQTDGAPDAVPSTGAAVRPASAGGAGTEVQPAVEQELWCGRPHWKNFAHVLALALGWTLLTFIAGRYAGAPAGWLCLAAAGAWLVAALHIATGMLKLHYRLTTQRLFVARGILSRTIDQTELLRIDDVRIHESLFDRLLGIGSLELLSTDTSHQQVMIRGISDPQGLADLIRHHMRLQRRSTLYVERL